MIGIMIARLSTRCWWWMILARYDWMPMQAHLQCRCSAVYDWIICSSAHIILTGGYHIQSCLGCDCKIMSMCSSYLSAMKASMALRLSRSIQLMNILNSEFSHVCLFTGFDISQYVQLIGLINFAEAWHPQFLQLRLLCLGSGSQTLRNGTSH